MTIWPKTLFKAKILTQNGKKNYIIYTLDRVRYQIVGSILSHISRLCIICMMYMQIDIFISSWVSYVDKFQY